MANPAPTAQDPPRVIARPSARRTVGDPSKPHRQLASRNLRTRSGEASTRASIGWDEPLFALAAPLLIATAALGFGLIGVTGRADTTAGLLVVPLLAGVVTLVVSRRLRPRYGAGFAWIVTCGLGVRYLAAIPRFLGGVDAVVYQREGVRLAQRFRGLDFFVDTGRTIPGTGSLRYASGLVNVLTGSSYLSTYLVFTTIAFIGQVFFLMAFAPSLNRRQFRLASIGVMVSPSLSFWPSSIGKEAAVLFGLGLTVYGVSRLYRREIVGMLPLLIGLAAVGLVRPHVALILLSGVVSGLFTRKQQGRPRIVLHGALLVAVLVGSMAIAGASASLFGLEDLDGIEDVSAALDFAQERTSQDQAQFIAPRVTSPADYPWATITVLFRPFPWEATNSMALLSSIEGVVLAGLIVAALGGLVRDRARIRRNGILLFGAAYVAVFVFLFSAIGNFGILSRQRAQVLPFVLVFVAVGIGADRVVDLRRRRA